MNPIVFVIDTGILIRHLRRDARYEAALRLIGQQGDPAISVVTRLEIVRGMRTREEQRTLELLSGLLTYPMDQRIADQAGRLLSMYQARGITLGIGDAIIAATAIQGKALLVTTNPRHFPMPELDVWNIDEEGTLQRIPPTQRGQRA
jgi:predicted nucleic acid-binding protein